ncbi:hypothetical protein JTB14_012887 [Gonioctena quinquepunctata]|nr:hypothetical protein JTB14_012887 [Gonioctena quinquepunctata]
MEPQLPCQNMSITNSIERVEELRSACNIPEGQLISSRTQGQLEDTATYVINMESLFGKLRNKPIVSKRVKPIRERMLPFIQARLPLGPVYSLSELLRLVATEQDCGHYGRHRLDAVATEFDWGQHEEFMEEASPQVELATLQQRYRPFQNDKCFNCGKMGHMMRDCQLPKATGVIAMEHQIERFERATSARRIRETSIWAPIRPRHRLK